jgi:crotonobetainyl-CoA:carnitine CoA-transferase CaiB-like acyl-CoA transferase
MRVLELSSKEEAAAFCGKLFRRWGAEVIKVENPDRVPPRQHLDVYLNGGKKRVALDYITDQGRLMELIGSADIVVTDVPPRGVDALGLFDEGIRTPVRVSVTPFGLGGPYRDFEATASTLLAIGGYTWLMGDPGREPLTMPGNYVFYQAGTYAYTAALAALRATPRTGPVTIEVSMLEALASLHQFTDTMWTFGGLVRSRHGNRWENLCPTTLLPCSDGWYGVNILQNFWFPFAHMIGRPDIASEGDLATNLGRMEHQDEVEDMTVKALWDKRRKDIFREGQEVWRVPIGYAATMADLVTDPHLSERQVLRPVRVPGRDEPVLAPGSPFRLMDEGLPEEPSLGDGSPPPSTLPARTVASTPSQKPARPLHGVRVLDLTRIWSGPLATRILGDLGAEVIKIEALDGRGGGGPAGVPMRRGVEAQPQSPPPGNPWNRQPLFNKLNRNKKSIAVDLKNPAGRKIFLDLVKISDVVIENFSARAMPSLGLSYEEMSAVNNQIIYVAMQAFGQFGPYRDYVGLGPSIEPVTGMQAIMGYSDEEPRVTSKALTDAIAGVSAASAVVTGLQRRDERGRGCLIDLSQHETGVTYIGEFLVEAQLAGHEPHRRGNRHSDFAPHGVYRCAGDDAWIAIAVRDDTQWQALRSSLGLPDDERFRTAAGRHENHDALDAAINGATGGRDKLDLAAALQSAGVAAGAVLSAPEYLSDRQLHERGYFVDLHHAEAGPSTWDGSPLCFNGQRGYEDWSAAPLLGADSRSLLSDLLSLPAQEVDALYASGVLADRPPERRD